jgi:hypothetical protein
MATRRNRSHLGMGGGPNWLRLMVVVVVVMTGRGCCYYWSMGPMVWSG